MKTYRRNTTSYINYNHWSWYTSLLAHLEEPHKQQTLASGRQPPHHYLVQSFECPDLPDVHTEIVREPWPIQREDLLVQLRKVTPFGTTVNHTPQSPGDSQNRFGKGPSHRSGATITIVGQFRNRFKRRFLGHLVTWTPNSNGTSPLMNQLSTQLTTKPSTEIHATPFAGTAAKNVLNWLKSFNWTATDNVCNDQKQLQVIPVYLKDTALNFELWALN